MSAVSVSTSVAVLIVVPLSPTVVVGLPTFAQSTPASPVALTSSVRAAVVGISAERNSIEKAPMTSPTTDTLSTVPVVMTSTTSVPLAYPLPLLATTPNMIEPGAAIEVSPSA